jgi:hypothetical protein
MKRNTLWFVASVLLIASLLLASCQPAATETTAVEPTNPPVQVVEPTNTEMPPTEVPPTEPPVEEVQPTETATCRPYTLPSPNPRA